MLLVQTSEVLLRPWARRQDSNPRPFERATAEGAHVRIPCSQCILEIHAAVTAGIPIVAVSLRGKKYDFSEAQHVLTYLDTELEQRNPGASQVLIQNDVQPLDAAYLLSNVVPNLIAVEFDAAASSTMIQASLDDMCSEITRLRESSKSNQSFIRLTRAEWSAHREAARRAAQAPVANSPRPPHTSNQQPQLAHLPADVPALPKGYVVRDAILTGIKGQIMHVMGPNVDDPKAAPVVAAQGMGGSGKTVIASALCNDPDVRRFFDKVCFVALGQTPDIRALQMVVYRQVRAQRLESLAQSACKNLTTPLHPGRDSSRVSRSMVRSATSI